MTPEDARMRFREDVSLVFEALGFGPMVGRTWAALLVSEEPHLSAQDLQDQIGASAGSISTSLSTLTRMGMIDRVWVPGDRRSYYVASPQAFDRLLVRRAEALTQLVAVAERGLDVFADVPQARERLQHMHDLYTWFDREYDVLLERWHDERREAEERRKKT